MRLICLAGKKPDITLTMDEKTFLDLAAGKGNAQKLFMQGKIKIKVRITFRSC